MRNIFALTALLCVVTAAVQAQSYEELALTFSRSVPGGSARIQGIGGAQIALGGDYSSALSNPAGLGMFNRSEFSFTPGLSFYNTDANYLGNNNSESTSKFIFPGISAVFHTPMQDGGGFVSGAFAVSMTRTNDFNRSTFFQGVNGDDSMIDYFIANSNGYNTGDNFDPDYGRLFNTPTELGYQNYLFGPASMYSSANPDTEYVTDVKGKPLQSETIKTSGSTNQWSFAYGANYRDILFVGAGVGISSLRYKSNRTYEEQFTDDPLKAFQMYESLSIRGTGINGTLGVTVRPADFVQVAVAYTTPTYYQFTEAYNLSEDSQWNNYLYYENKPNYEGRDSLKVLTAEHVYTDEITSDYSLTVPGKVSGGVAFIIKKFGIISGDVEYTKYNNAKYSSSGDISYKAENDGIGQLYRSALNYRFGAEFRYKVLRVRGGYGIQASPYADGNADNQIRTITGGLGARFQKVHIDLAIVRQSENSFYQPYPGSPVAEFKTGLTTGMLTFGFNF